MHVNIVLFRCVALRLLRLLSTGAKEVSEQESSNTNADEDSRGERNWGSPCSRHHDEVG